MGKRVAILLVVVLTGASTAFAQSSTAGSSQPQQSGGATTSSTAGSQQSGSTTQPTMSGDVTTRPATTTVNGDTGLWFVPTGEIVPAKKYAISAYRVNFDRDQGFTDVSDWPVTFAFGAADRAEIFGAWTLVRRIDRDVRPLFVSTEPVAGGLVNEHPFVRQGWSGNQLGDLWLGAKVNLTSQWRQQPLAFAVRGMFKIPTAKDDEEGVGTGKMDFAFDAIASKEVNERVEISGYGGFIFRGDPDGIDLANGLRWGFGVGVPSRKSLRFTAELHGERYLSDSVTIEGPLATPLIAVDGTAPPLVTELASPVNATFGLTWQGSNGVFAGAGIGWNLNMKARDKYFSGFDDRTGDAAGWQFRIGYHPGVRVYVPPAPPPPPPPAPAAAAPTHTLTVRAQCNPCSVEVGQVSTVTATAMDSIGCAVTYSWSAPTGTFSDRTNRQTPWTAPQQPGTVPVTVTVTCPQDGKTASDTVNIQVTARPVREFTFEDVHFDFDRYSLRPEATRALDEAIATMQANPTLNIEIEGHTCNIGTAEYNLALGERRATAVREYLSSRGIGANRLRTVSYGEERPKHDNSREETRRLNRRAALVVRLQQ
jgi:outer membrane protein OmpA-like peptidoglycan-associated protein